MILEWRDRSDAPYVLWQAYAGSVYVGCVSNLARRKGYYWEVRALGGYPKGENMTIAGAKRGVHRTWTRFLAQANLQPKETT